MSKSTRSGAGRKRMNEKDQAARQAVEKLLANPDRMRRLAAKAQQSGGMYRAIGGELGVSQGALNKYLAELGLSIDRQSKSVVTRHDPERSEKAVRLVQISLELDDLGEPHHSEIVAEVARQMLGIR